MAVVAVVGMGARTPCGRGPRELLAGLSEAQPRFTPYEPFRVAGVRAPVAAVVPDSVLRAGASGAREERGATMLEGAVRDALEEAFGRPELPAHVAPARIALFIGTSSSGLGPFCAAQKTGLARAEDDARYGSASAQVARSLGLKGPMLVICSVCASGALAIAEAAELVSTGEVDLAIAAGFDPLEPFVGRGFDSLQALTDLPRPFRAGRRGLCLGEGSAALVLCRAHEQASVAPRGHAWGTVAGWGGSADAHHLTAPDPQGRGVALAIERALARAGLAASDVDVVNAHGTGTPFNDAMETAALGRVFGPRAGNRPVYTVKGTIGHTLGAAGAIEAVASFAAMEADVIPPTVTGGPDDPRCDLDLVVDRPRAVETRHTLSLSSAFGGANCALLLARGGRA